jgi:hypothetical protein
MSTDLHDRTRPPSPGERPEQPEKPKSSFSVAQVIGGALAAMTAAALGSRLSLAGTVIGAAFASVIAAVAGAIYTASLRRTSKHVGAVLTRVRPTPGAPPASSDAATTTTGTTVDEGAATWVLPAQPDPAAGGASPAPTPGLTISWKKVVVGAALMFVIAALVLTGIELVTGRALSGGTGTTVGQVAEPGTRPSSTPTRRASATPSPTPSGSSSAKPSPSASAIPPSTPTAEPSATATRAPSTTPTPTPSATAAPSATPTALGAPSGATPAS